MIKLDKLIAISQFRNDDSKWLSNAEDGVDYLISQLSEEHTIIFAALEATLIQAVLAVRDKVSPADQEDLSRAMILQDRSWSITHCSGGGMPDQVYLSDPLEQAGCKSLVGGEALVFRRHFDSVDKDGTRTEVSQKLVHALDLYWLDEERAYCRLDEHGDIEPVLSVIDLGGQTGRKGDVVVTIKARDLARYMVVTKTAFVWKFDFTRFVPSKFVAWAGNGVHKVRGPDLFYNAFAQGNASYANGIIVSRPSLTHDELVHQARERYDLGKKKYAKFIAHDWKNKKIEEISCAPSALASYFEKDSPLPFQITPAFFRPDVLQRYKADPEKYTLEHRSIHSRAGWSLSTYDINDAGQVHTYLHYLGQLPYAEQIYWQSFNERPKSSISKRAFQTDIQGEWTDIPDPLIELISEVRKLDRAKLDWWNIRGEELCKTVHYPVTTSVEEWSNSILAFDQMLIEGFATKPIRSRLDALKTRYDKDWGSLRLIQELLVAQGWAPSDAIEATEPLRRLHMLRSKAKGHATGAEKRALVVQAKADHGSLKDHFLQLAFDCQEAFERVCKCLDLSSSERTLPPKIPQPPAS